MFIKNIRIAKAQDALPGAAHPEPRIKAPSLMRRRALSACRRGEETADSIIACQRRRY
jgi:hypothetical protein